MFAETQCAGGGDRTGRHILNTSFLALNSIYARDLGPNQHTKGRPASEGRGERGRSHHSQAERVGMRGTMEGVPAWSACCLPGVSLWLYPHHTTKKELGEEGTIQDLYDLVLSGRSCLIFSYHVNLAKNKQGLCF